MTTHVRIGWGRWPSLVWLHLIAIVVVVLPAAAAAQVPRSTGATIGDSTSAVRTACKIVQALRAESEHTQCRVESFRETSTDYIVRVRETAPPGSNALVFPHSEIRFQKSATVRNRDQRT
jgi:hypothetical protein